MITVGIVDEHFILLSALNILLNGQDDIKVVGTAGNLASAVELIKSKTPDVVLLDISMLEMNGFVLIPRFKRISPESKILIMTINDGEGRCLQKGFELGVSGFLVKKAMDYDLIYAIRTVARGEIYIYPSIVEEYIIGNKKSNIQDGKLIKEEEFLWNSLSSREQEVIIDIAHGFKNKEIAKKYFLSEKTVETYRLRAMGKLGFKKKSDLVDFVILKLKILKK
jgi:DNA-binding NarL/FixJ family response regulator